MIDGGIFWGRNPATGLELTDVAAFLDARGARAAIVSAHKSVFLDFREGNDELLAMAARLPGRVIPGVIVSPWGWDVVADRDLLAVWRERGARVLVMPMAPKYYDLDLGSGVLARAARQAADLGYVLQAAVDSLEALTRAIERFAGLGAPLLMRWVGGGGYFPLAEMVQAGVDHENVFFDVGGLTCLGGVALLAERLGAGRLFAASGAPEQIPECSDFLLRASGLSAEARRAVRGGNLARLLGLAGASPEMSEEDQPADPFADQPIIDIHFHLGGLNLLEPGADPAHPACAAWRARCRRLVVSATRALNHDIAQGNAAVADWAAQAPNARGLVVVDPTRPEESLRQIERHGAGSLFVGLKTIQDLYGFGLDHPAYGPLLDAAEERGWPVLAHIPGLLAAARARPGLTFVCAHSTWGRVQPMLDQPNIVFDLSTSHRDAADSRLDRLLQAAGAERLLMASDGPLIHPAWTLAKLAACRFPAAVLRRVLHDNALAVFPRLALGGPG